MSLAAPKSPEYALQELLALPIVERRDAIARDMTVRSPRFCGIDAHDLAHALDVPQPELPCNDWSFTRYARIETVEEYVESWAPGTELIYLIENLVKPARFRRLLELSKPLDQGEVPSFLFLKGDEREALEHAIAAKQLENNHSNGLCCIAHYSVTSSSGDDLQFEGEIEDDGSCDMLRTPYDKQAGRFLDLTGCLTDHW